MAEHFRFSVCYWHTFKATGSDTFGGPTFIREYNKSSDPMQVAEMTLQAAFEFYTKLGVSFWCFHDRDIAPEGRNLSQTNANLDKIVAMARKMQRNTGVRCLWGTANLFSNRRYLAGAATNPSPEVFAYAAAQAKKAMEITKELGGAGYVFWGGREGYETLLNTDMKRELDHLGQFLHMAVDYKKKIGFRGQFYIEPKPKEPTKHQYDSDAGACYAFLQKYDLVDHFKLNVEANHATLAGHTFHHELEFAAANGILGSIDANRGDQQNGWDTDQFPMDLGDLVECLLVILRAGGFRTGGVNFDAKTRRNSTDLADIFHAHIGGMDAFARALLIADSILAAGKLDALRKDRYASFDSGKGRDFEQGKLALDDLRAIAVAGGEPAQTSGRQEFIENLIFNALR